VSTTPAADRFTALSDDETLAETVSALEEHGFAVDVVDDLDAARDAVRPWLAFYLGSMGAKDKNFYVDLAERMGHGDAARAVIERVAADYRSIK